MIKIIFCWKSEGRRGILQQSWNEEELCPIRVATAPK